MDTVLHVAEELGASGVSKPPSSDAVISVVLLVVLLVWPEQPAMAVRRRTVALTKATVGTLPRFSWHGNLDPVPADQN